MVQCRVRLVPRFLRGNIYSTSYKTYKTRSPCRSSIEENSQPAGWFRDGPAVFLKHWWMEAARGSWVPIGQWCSRKTMCTLGGKLDKRMSNALSNSEKEYLMKCLYKWFWWIMWMLKNSFEVYVWKVHALDSDILKFKSFSALTSYVP